MKVLTPVAGSKCRPGRTGYVGADTAIFRAEIFPAVILTLRFETCAAIAEGPATIGGYQNAATVTHGTTSCQ